MDWECGGVYLNRDIRFGAKVAEVGGETVTDVNRGGG
jgi:hypothetical protein